MTIVCEQFVTDFDYVTYDQAVALRRKAERFSSPLMYEAAAREFDKLGMPTAALRCRERAEHYRSVTQ